MYGANNQHFVTLKLEVIELETLPIRITKPSRRDHLIVPTGSPRAAIRITKVTDFQAVTKIGKEEKPQSETGVFLSNQRNYIIEI